MHLKGTVGLTVFILCKKRAELLHGLKKSGHNNDVFVWRGSSVLTNS